MPRKKVTRNKFSGFKMSDSYISLFLGILVVIIIALVGFSFLKLEKNSQTKQTSSTSTVASEEELAKNKNLNLSEKYTIKAGDDLWSISEKIYKSGYNWIDIAKANRISNPETIYAGMQLTIPDVKPIVPEIAPQTVTTQAEGAILTSSYTVASGDNLWDISVRAYGDGYKWVDLARENKLLNPSLIYPGDVFKIPR